MKIALLVLLFTGLAAYVHSNATARRWLWRSFYVGLAFFLTFVAMVGFSETSFSQWLASFKRPIDIAFGVYIFFAIVVLIGALFSPKNAQD